MRSTILAAAFVALSAASAFAAPSEDAAYDKNNGPVIDSRGNCVRTKWQDKNDPCAAPTPKKVVAQRPAPKPAPAPAPVPVVSREARTIYFDFNKATLTADSQRKLDSLAKTINESSAITDVTVHGFTDQLGTDSYNEALSQKRVDAAKAYLDSKSRLKTEGDIKGMGKAPAVDGCGPIKKRAEKIACMAKQRRVEIEFNAQK